MEHGCHVEIVASTSDSVADVDVARLPQSAVHLERSVDDSTVFGYAHRGLSLQLLRNIVKRELSNIRGA